MENIVIAGTGPAGLAAASLCAGTDVFIAAGSSLAVQPATGLPVHSTILAICCCKVKPADYFPVYAPD